MQRMRAGRLLWRAASTVSRTEHAVSDTVQEQLLPVLNEQARPVWHAVCASSSTSSCAAVPNAAAEPSPAFFTKALLAHALADCTQPAAWYPTARSLRRRVIAHLGPTNSGKTHAALQALKQARSGVYAGPLRLLASEVAERLNAAGVPCNLITGQERKEAPDGAQHTACTVEMVSTKHVCDVGVVDEIQLAADASRGWSFTRALLGLPARELHVCGDPAMLPLLRHICSDADEPLEVRTYERLSALRPARQALGSLDKLASGDCVVAFSRRGVHALRQEIESLGRHSVAVVYGALPPGPRRQQATLFNTPRSGVGVLAASDAIGMGLNLCIKRLIFSTMRKFDGVEDRLLTPAEIKQIAGRAGRHLRPGVCTTLDAEDLPLLQEGLASPHHEYTTAAIMPPFAMLEAFAARLYDARQLTGKLLPAVLDSFEEAATTSELYLFSQPAEVRTLAEMVRHFPLTLREAYLFSLAPCDPGDTPVARALLLFAEMFARHRRVPSCLVPPPPVQAAHSEAELQGLEAAYRVHDLFVWLAFRFPECEGREEIEVQRTALAALIDRSLREMGLPPRRRRSRPAAAEPALGVAMASQPQTNLLNASR